MKFGLTPSEFNFITKEIFEPLKKAGAEVWVFGSRARGDFKKFSDLDCLHAFSTTKREPQGLVSQIKETLEESNFPYKVDLVNIKDLPESYKESVLKDRVSV